MIPISNLVPPSAGNPAEAAIMADYKDSRQFQKDSKTMAQELADALNKAVKND